MACLLLGLTSDKALTFKPSEKMTKPHTGTHPLPEGTGQVDNPTKR